MFIFGTLPNTGLGLGPSLFCIIHTLEKLVFYTCKSLFSVLNKTGLWAEPCIRPLVTVLGRH